MLEHPPLIDANPGDPITSESWNNMVQSIKILYELHNKKSGSLAISLVNKNGNAPILGATVTVIDVDTAQNVYVGIFAGGKIDKYIVPNIKAGKYQVLAEAEGFSKETRELAVTEAGENQILDIPMTATESLSPMPNLFGLLAPAAIKAVAAAGFNVDRIITSHGKDEIDDDLSPEAKQSVVLNQVPEPDTLLPVNFPIQLHISSKSEFKAQVKVPDIKGLTFEEAKIKLESVGLNIGTPTTGKF